MIYKKYKKVKGQVYNFCTKCLKYKPKTDFHKYKGAKDGLNSACKECYSVYQKEYKLNNPEKFASYQKPVCVYDPNREQYRDTHPDKWKTYYDKYRKMRLSEPLVKMKLKLANRVKELIKTGDITRPDNCSECDSKPKKVCAYFHDKVVKMFLKSDTVQINHGDITWICPKCVMSKRRKPNNKK